jgi:catechol 2,3-dioxygenase-like lactoylglutathione lyase family enzyme
MNIVQSIDHIVLTVKDIDATIQFYTTILGMKASTFKDGRWALSFGTQKINLHQLGNEFKPNASHANAGTLDICFVSTIPLNDVKKHLTNHGIELEIDIVERTGANGIMKSIYFRDLDGNLIEISNY